MIDSCAGMLRSFPYLCVDTPDSAYSESRPSFSRFREWGRTWLQLEVSDDPGSNGVRMKGHRKLGERLDAWFQLP